MSIIKINGLEREFTIVPNETANANLSWAARGMLLYLCSKPENWAVRLSDLMQQTKESSKPTGRDGVNAIINELVHCGYMRKSNRRLKGKFAHNDYEVSLRTMTDLPSTVQPLTVNPPLQSKECTKKGIKKESITDSKQSLPMDIPSQNILCKEAINFITVSGLNAYTGKLTASEWEDCELAMSSVDCFDEGYISWWMETRSQAFKKRPSLVNMLCDFNGLAFNEFYEKVYLNECD